MTRNMTFLSFKWDNHDFFH